MKELPARYNWPGYIVKPWGVMGSKNARFNLAFHELENALSSVVAVT